jgi:hypothetical protein
MNTMVLQWFSYHGIAMVCIPWYCNVMNTMVLQWYAYCGIVMVCISWYRNSMHTIGMNNIYRLFLGF